MLAISKEGEEEMRKGPACSVLVCPSSCAEVSAGSVVPLNGVSTGGFILLYKASELKEQGTVVMYIRKLSDRYALSVAHMDPFWPQISLQLLSI